MAPTYSTMLEAGTPIPPFELPVTNPDVDDLPGSTRRLEDYVHADVLVVVFMCNHCPYVQAVEDRLVHLAASLSDRGVQFVAISPNDPVAYPEDAPENMGRRAIQKGYPFPYLFDASQDVTRAFRAACTPEFFVFGPDRRLRYQGRLDDGRPGREPTTSELKDAIIELLETGAVTVAQHPAMGCSIKWRS